MLYRVANIFGTGTVRIPDTLDLEFFKCIIIDTTAEINDDQFGYVDIELENDRV